MLEKARGRAKYRPDVTIELFKDDLNKLIFEDNAFDVVVGSFIFMVVSDPLKALQEVRRVCQPSGKLFLLEFTRSQNRLIGLFQDLLTPLTRIVYHANLNRDIAGLIQSCGFEIIETDPVGNGLVKIMVAVLI
jgi:ubiquinone/menaquinone biosynthesis C-methylase UbiE